MPTTASTVPTTASTMPTTAATPTFAGPRSRRRHDGAHHDDPGQSDEFQHDSCSPPQRLVRNGPPTIGCRPPRMREPALNSPRIALYVPGRPGTSAEWDSSADLCEPRGGYTRAHGLIDLIPKGRLSVESARFRTVRAGSHCGIPPACSMIFRMLRSPRASARENGGRVSNPSEPFCPTPDGIPFRPATTEHPAREPRAQ
jgi:hypothetical protein